MAREYYLYLKSTNQKFVPPGPKDIYAFVLTWRSSSGARTEKPIYWGRSFPEVREQGQWISDIINQGLGEEAIAERLLIPGGSEFAFYEVVVTPHKGTVIPQDVIDQRDKDQAAGTFTN